MNIHRPEITSISALVPDLWKLICLISSDTADHENILTVAIKRWKVKNSKPSLSQLSIDIKKLVIELECEAAFSEFRERLNYLDVSQVSLTVFYYSYVHLKTIQQIADQLNLDYSTAGDHLRQVVLALRQQRNFAA